MSALLPHAVGTGECHQNYDESAEASKPWHVFPESEARHEGVACDSCLACPIMGIRHRCLLCPGADFCGTCVAKQAHPPDHPTLALRVALQAEAWEWAVARIAFPAGLALRGCNGAPPSAEAQALFDELGAVAERHVLAPAGVSPGAAYRSSVLQQRAAVRAAVGRGGRATLLEPELFTPVLSRALGLPGGQPGGVQYFGTFGVAPPQQLGTAYRPRHDALCLVSLADGLPVAALQLLPLDGGGAETGRAALMPLLADTGGCAPPPHVFEGLLSADGAHLGLALTNLCASGALCMELTRVEVAPDWSVAAAAPQRLNAANVLRAGESVAVQADAANGRALLLQALRDAATGATQPVAANLAATPQRKRGAHLRLRVTPQAGHPALAARLRAGVRWAVLDMFVREPPALPTGPPPATAPVSLFGAQASPFGTAAASPTAPLSPFAAAAAPFGAPQGAAGACAPTFGAFGAAPAAALAFGAPAAAAPAFDSSTAFGAAPALGASQGFGAARHTAAAPIQWGPPAAAAAAAGTFRFGPSAAAVPPAAPSPAAAAAAAAARAAVAVHLLSAVAEGAAAAAAPMALSAAVAALEVGAPVPPQPVAPAPAGLTWDAVLAADALIGLAVQPALSAAALQPCAAGLAARAGELLTALERGSAARELLASLTAVLVSTQCVACLESSPPPDTVFTPCGHQCMHWEEAARVERCPLCRRFISGRLCVADGRFVGAPLRPARAFRSRPEFFADAMARPAKPVVYLYPAEGAALPMDAVVSVRLAGGASARFTALVPAATSRRGADEASWRVRVLSRAGLLAVTPPEDGSALPPPVTSLFWESEAPRAHLRLPGPGCVSVLGAALGGWLLRALRDAGLTPREYTEMASYWVARLGHHAWVALRLITAAEVDADVAALEVQPAPDTVLRVYLLCRGVDAPPAWAPQAPPPPPEADAAAASADMDAACVPRTGFTVVEWGGCEL